MELFFEGIGLIASGLMTILPVFVWMFIAFWIAVYVVMLRIRNKDVVLELSKGSVLDPDNHPSKS